MDTPDFFVGARLGGARVKAGISLEKAAKDTRIRVQRLREIEADDFSGFTHPTYSRLFLLDYAEYLGISPDEIRPLLPDRAGAAGGGFEYINALARDPSSPVVPMRHKKPSLLKIIVAVGILLILVAAGLFIYSTVRKLERVTGSSPAAAKAAPEIPAASPAPEGETMPEPSATQIPEEGALPSASQPIEEPSDGQQLPTPTPVP